VQKLYSGGVLGILFVFTTTPARSLFLCVNTNIVNAFAAVCAYSTVKNAEKIVEEKKHLPSFLQVTAITRVFSISLSVFFTWNFSNRKACVKKHLRALSCRKSTPPCPVTNPPSSSNRPRRGRLNEPLPVTMYRITSHGK